MLLEAGINPKVVSERLGHASIATTVDIYSRVLPDMQEKAALAIDEALSGKEREAVDVATSRRDPNRPPKAPNT